MPLEHAILVPRNSLLTIELHLIRQCLAKCVTYCHAVCFFLRVHLNGILALVVISAILTLVLPGSKLRVVPVERRLHFFDRRQTLSARCKLGVSRSGLRH